MNYPDTQFIELERSGFTAAPDQALGQSWMSIWFNQPEKRNPLSPEATAELMAVLEILKDDRSVRGVTLRGRGGVFSAGGDLKSFQNDFQSGASRDDIMAMSRGMAELLGAFNSLPQVTISIIEGAAVAGGFGLVCCSDIVICDAGAKFSMSETLIGLSPAQIAPFVIQRLGAAAARRLMLTGARLNAQQALEHGLADYVADSADTLTAQEAHIRAQVQRCAPGAVADTKALLIALPKLSRDEAVQAAAQTFASRLQSDEAAEGIGSFFEKRKPNWAK